MNKALFQQIACVDATRDESAPLNSARIGARLVVWVEAYRVKAGDIVTFKQTGDMRWRVANVYSTLASDLNRGWGLDLPKSERTER